MTDKSTAGRDGEAGSTGFARVSIEAPRIDAATGLLGKEAFFDEAAAALSLGAAVDEIRPAWEGADEDAPSAAEGVVAS